MGSYENNVSVPPLTVNILGKSRIPIAGQNQTIKCEVSGSRPMPKITWWRDHIELTGSVIQVNIINSFIYCINLSVG